MDGLVVDHADRRTRRSRLLAAAAVVSAVAYSRGRDPRLADLAPGSAANVEPVQPVATVRRPCDLGLADHLDVVPSQGLSFALD